VLEPNEIITEIRVPRTSGSAGAGTAYRKFHHPASGFAVVGVAAVVRMKGASIESAAVGITGVADHAFRAAGVEKALTGKPTSTIAEASEKAAQGIDALGDHFASAEYRKHLAAVYTRRALEAAVAARKP